LQEAGTFKKELTAMRKMTEANLNTAYSGESMAHMRYNIYADVAEAEGKPNIARLFRSISFAEKVHATNHYREIGAIRSTVDNLQVAIDGETYEVEDMQLGTVFICEVCGYTVEGKVPDRCPVCQSPKERFKAF